jgi:hypothetical protein
MREYRKCRECRDLKKQERFFLRRSTFLAFALYDIHDIHEQQAEKRTINTGGGTNV